MHTMTIRYRLTVDFEATSAEHLKEQVRDFERRVLNGRGHLFTERLPPAVREDRLTAVREKIVTEGVTDD